jgi:hypothetical protein
MRNKILIILSFLTTITYAQGDYTITINGEKKEIELDKEYVIKAKKKDISFSVSANDTILYKNEMFSFKYPKEFKITKLDIAEGIEQIVIMTAEGTGIMFQKYNTMNPTMLNEMMINEVTKESINYGYKLDRQDYIKKLKSGQDLEVDKAVLTYKDEMNSYEIASFGKKDQGVIIMVMEMSNILSPNSEKLIKLMWESLYIF